MLIESGALIVNVCVVEACMSFERWKLMRVMTRLTEPEKQVCESTLKHTLSSLTQCVWMYLVYCYSISTFLDNNLTENG